MCLGTSHLTFLGLFSSVVKILYVKPTCAVVAIDNPGIIMNAKQ